MTKILENNYIALDHIQHHKKSATSFWQISLLIGFFSILLMSFTPVFAITTVDWIDNTVTIADFADVDMRAGDAVGLVPDVHLRIVDTDSGFNGNTISDTISVDFTSSTGDTVTLILHEVADLGEFVNDKIIFMKADDGRIALGNTLTISSIEDSKIGNAMSNEILSGIGDGAFVYSDSDNSGVPIDMFEIDDTGVFTRTLSFCSAPGCSDGSTATLEINSNDVVTFLRTVPDFPLVNGYVVSNTTGDGAIITEDSGTVTATYNGINKTVTILDGGPGGGGGGGLVNPGLVVDSVLAASSQGSGCEGDCTPPTLGVDKDNTRLVQEGFSYNGNPVDVELYYTPYPLITVDVGKENLSVLKIYDDSGTQNIEHVGLAFGLGKGESFNDSKATINLDRTREGTETTFVYDPENVLDDIRVATETGSCSNSILTDCLIVYIYHTFREPLNFNMVGTLVWDFDRNTWQNYYNHGIHITGKSLNPPKTSLVYFGTHGMHDTYELTRIDKLNDLWQDEFGNIYQHKGNDRYDRVYSEPKPFVRDALTSHGCDRNCNWFNEYKLEQEVLAKKKLTEMLAGKIIEGESLEDPFTIYFHIVKRSEDPVLQQNIKDEIKKATDLYMQIYPKKPVHNFLN